MTPAPSFSSIARSRSVARLALRVAAVVGVVLTTINPGDRLPAGDLSAEVLLKIPLTVSVPYCVSTWLACVSIREVHGR